MNEEMRCAECKCANGGVECTWIAQPRADDRLYTQADLDAAVAAGDVWTGTKRQKEALRNKFGGRCAYCGDVLTKMHADHLKPVIRVQNDPWGRRLPSAEQRMIYPDRDTVGNMMPACGPCNLHKAGYSLEEWRALLERSPDILAREKSIFRAARRFGLIEVKSEPIKFYFERFAIRARGET